MRVLKKGPDTDWGKELRCMGYGLGTTGGCGALLLVSPRDVKSHYDDGDTSYWFVCPECGARTHVTSRTFSQLQGGVS